MGIRTSPVVLHKSPSEVVLKNFSFAAHGDLSPTETILSVPTYTITAEDEVSPTLVFYEPPAIDGQVVQVKLSGGTGGIVYSVQILVTTSNGQTLEAVGRLHVEGA